MSKKQKEEAIDGEENDPYEDWDLDEYVLFGPNRKFKPLTPQLIRVYGATLDGNVPQLAEQRSRVMFLAVKLPEFEVLEHFFAGADFTDDQWRQIFRKTMVSQFVSTSAEVYDRAFELHKTGNFKGKGAIHRICMRADELYPLMNAEEQAEQRGKVWKGVQERLHPDRRQRRPSQQTRPTKKKTKTPRNAMRGSVRPPRIALRGDKMQKPKK